MNMRPIDVLNNIRGNDYDIGHYGLCKAEADVCIDALMKQISYKVEPAGNVGGEPVWKCECGAKISGRVSKHCYICGRPIEYSKEVEE